MIDYSIDNCCAHTDRVGGLNVRGLNIITCVFQAFTVSGLLEAFRTNVGFGSSGSRMSRTAGKGEGWVCATGLQMANRGVERFFMFLSLPPSL